MGQDELATPLRWLGRIAQPRVVIVRAGGLGDTLLLLPALQWLRERLSAARLTLVGSRWAEAIRPLVPFPLETARFDAPSLAPLFADGAEGRVPALFREAHAVVLYTADAGSAFVRNVERDCPGTVRTWPVEPRPGRHAAAHLLDALTDRRLSPADLAIPALEVPPELREPAGVWLEKHVPDRRSTALHPGSGGRAKCWPAERFVEVANRLGRPLLLVEGPADEEACRVVRSGLSPAVAVTEAQDLAIPELAALLQRCERYIGNDSGVTHLAAALGLPTVAVFGPTDPAVWAPLGPRVEVVSVGAGRWPAVEPVIAALRRSS
jgi:heptosyltransferase-2